MAVEIINLELKNLVDQKLDTSTFLQKLDRLLTQQKQELKRLQDEHDRLNVIVDLIPSTISWVNRDMTYFAVNRALAEACGVDRQSFVGQLVGFHTKERFFETFVRDLFASTSKTIYREIEASIHGLEHNYLVSGTKLADGDRAVIIGVDISELKQLQGRVSFTEKLATLGEMFAGIIHDINNPLAMIEGNVFRIRQLTEDPKILELLDKVDMSARKVSKIIKGIKIYVRQDGAVPFQVEELGQILDDAIIICENRIRSNGVLLKVDPLLKNIKLNCHFTELFQVFVNLIVNSIDAIQKNSDKWIEIKLTDSGDSTGLLKIEFTDSGHGIPIEIQDKIFNAFFTTKERGVGSGLGLSLCTKILEAHGGHLKIDNDRPNTTFLIELKK